MHTFDLNLDWVAEEERSAEALGSSDEDLNGFIDYFHHGSDSDVFQSNQTRIPEESISASRVIISRRNEGMDFDFGELGLGFGLDSDTNNEASSFDLNVTVTDLEMLDVQSCESSSSSFSSSMRELELVCEEDFRLLVNESNPNNQEVISEIVQDVEENESNEFQFFGMMVDDLVVSNNNEEVEVIGMNINAADEDDGVGVDYWFLVNESNPNNQELLISEIVQDVEENESNEFQFLGMMVDDLVVSNNNDEVEGIGMNINAADEDDGVDMYYSFWNNVHNEIVENGPYLDGFDDDDGEDGMLFSWEIWPAVDSEWDDMFHGMLSMQTVKCSDVDNLPSVTLTQEELNKNNSICAICMENFCVEEKLKRLPCFHYYHVDCISPWLRTRNTCPTCRYELPII